MIINKPPQRPKGGDRYNITRMLPRHFKILELALAGHAAKAIAESVGMERNSVSMVLRSPLFQAELTKRRRETVAENAEVARNDRDGILGRARITLENAVERAASRQVELLEADNEAVALKASTLILDRAIGKAEEQTAPKVQITIEQANLLCQAEKESNNGRRQESTAHSEAANPPEDQQGDVRPEPAARRQED